MARLRSIREGFSRGEDDFEAGLGLSRSGSFVSAHVPGHQPSAEAAPLPRSLAEARSGETPRERDAVRQLEVPSGAFDDEPSHQEEAPPSSIPRGPSVSAPPGANAAPPMPRMPTPMAGAVSRPEQQVRSSEGTSTASLPSSDVRLRSGLVPFKPMGAPSVGQMVRPQGALYGSLGGLKGGGLGVPFDSVSDQLSDPIDQLMQLLRRR